MRKQIIVNEQDEVIAYKDTSEVLASDIYRVSILWITDDTGKILLARRSMNKAHDPGKWEPAVAGTLEEGETYESNIIKETKEELGFDVDPKYLTSGPKLFLGQDWIFFCQTFLYQCTKHESEFTLQKEEVMEVKWYEKDELFGLMDTKPDMFVQNFAAITQRLTSAYK